MKSPISMASSTDWASASSSPKPRLRCCVTRPSNAHSLSQRNIGRRKKCCSSQSTCHNLWRCPWSILRLDWAFQDWWQPTRHKLLIFGWLRWQRLLFSGDCVPVAGPEGALQRQDYYFERESWVENNYSELRFLRWVYQEVWEHKHMENVHWPLWLSSPDSCSVESDLWNPWGTVPTRRYPWSCQETWQGSGGSTRWSHLWSFVEWPRRALWLQHEP